MIGTVVLIVLILLLLGNGGWGWGTYRAGYPGPYWGGTGLLVVLIILLLLFARPYSYW